ncbi:DUF2971 domain-containing protein [Bradyrhizobium sp. Arg816]|uniref:DUF2971 domain-containing protein n=1 Tax=Bradyrhizobium sp. Arg816 TaxID=2998491 RepID=UPI00249EF621|nr:DUF2971 domain-containing protein [Bradyrhizobium sp. Arg816]MDI3566059.1 DUF2971 domain-containing protein [Bradyrhizobium sp. Arg816]
MNIVGQIVDRFHYLRELARPRTVFRYRVINDYTVSELATQSLYFSAYPDLNDPNEGTYEYEPTWNDRDARLFIQAVRKRGAGAEGFRALFPDVEIDALAAAWESMSDEQVLTAIRDRVEKNLASPEIRTRINDALRDLDDMSIGVCCFSAAGRSPYMSWFYGAQHKGVCFEYSTAQYPFNRIMPVRYTSSIPKLITGRNFVLAKMLTKSVEWKGEKEWRIVQHLIKRGRFAKFDANALLSVHLGPKASHDDIKRIVDAIRQRQSATGHLPSVYQFRRAKSTFAFELKKIDID